MISPSVTTLLQDARNGSPEALDRLLASCGPRLLSLIRLRMGPALRARMESGDLLNATLLRAFKAFDRLDAKNTPSLMAWLGRVAESEIRDQVDRVRAQRRDVALDVPLDAGDGFAGVAATLRSQTSRLVLDESLRRLEREIERLPAAQREVVLLRRFEERSFKEIAERLDKSPDACRMLLARAMTTLTLRLREAE